MRKERIALRANPECKFCLGTGAATPVHILCGKPVCRCVTEQIRIIYSEPDYTIPENKRYVPGNPQYILDKDE